MSKPGFTLDGKPVPIDAEPTIPLLRALRGDLELNWVGVD